MSAIWIPFTTPCCPVCGEYDEHVKHDGCIDNGKMDIDITTGAVRCNACGKITNLDRRYGLNCECGAVYKGWQIWQGKDGEIGQTDDLAWLMSADRRREDFKAQFLGWWFCQGCGIKFEEGKKIKLVRAEDNAEGLCDACRRKPRPVEQQPETRGLLAKVSRFFPVRPRTS